MEIIYKYILYILLFTCLGFTQDTLITKQGKQYIGKVIDSDSILQIFYLNSAEVFLEPKVPKSFPTYKDYKNNKKKLKKEKYLSFSIKDRAIYDAKIKARKWFLYPTLYHATFFSFSIICDLRDHDFRGLLPHPEKNGTLSFIGTITGIALPYYTLKRMDNFSDTKFYTTYNDFEKQIYRSSYKKTLRRRKILYSTLGIPVPIFISFARAMADLSFGPYTGL